MISLKYRLLYQTPRSTLQNRSPARDEKQPVKHHYQKDNQQVILREDGAGLLHWLFNPLRERPIGFFSKRLRIERALLDRFVGDD
jgi:hypothetical protein